MNSKKSNRLEPPLKMDRELFINPPQNITAPSNRRKLRGRAQAVTFTLYNTDIDALEHQLDRATSLNKRNKNKSVIIRMALKALENCSDQEYSRLYEEF